MSTDKEKADRVYGLHSNEERVMKTYKWTIEIQVADTWVADGFDLSNENLQERILEKMLPYAHEHERSMRVVKKPHALAIAREQGYVTKEEET